jgi:PUB domain/Ubiquitin family
VLNLDDVVSQEHLNNAEIMLSFNVKINENVHAVSDVEGTLFVGEVKSIVESISGVSKDCQKWIYKGRILTDQMTLNESNIVDGNTVIVMRTAPTLSPATTTTASSSTATASNSESQRLSAGHEVIRSPLPTVQFDNAIFELLQNGDELIIQACVSTLLKVISNVIAHPMEEKYRRLNRTNAAFAKKVGTVAGGTSCMVALGFQLAGDDWILVPNSGAWDNIVFCQTKLEKFSKRLGDQISRKGAAVAAPVATAETTTPAAPTNPVDPQIMQQFLQSLAAMQTSLPSQENSVALVTPLSEADNSADGDAPDSSGENEEEEEIIPQL